MDTAIIITTKDRVSYLFRAVDSIFEQTIKPNEIIIVDDCSIVKVPEQILSLYKSKASNLDIVLKYYYNPVSMGGNFSRNFGANNTSAEILFFLDDDDIYTPNAIEDKLTIFKHDNNIGMVYTGIKFVTSDNLETIKRYKRPLSKKISFHSLLKFGNIVGPTSSVAVRKNDFIKAGMFDKDLIAMQDYELWIRMARCSDVVHDNGMNLIYTIHTTGEQISSKHEKYLRAAEYIFNKFSKEIEALNAHHHFWSEVYFRVALSASHSSEFKKIRYASKSFLLRPSIKSLALLLPTFALRKIKPFV
ncbi:TPA: glycosyltransferase family A protein [Vibrio cholerae]|uniref:Putative glycosyltransferase n=1 Tax=Vibrio cholerae TaxID=666 RepID=A0T1U5_VIBCL|nr:putative glycosyltransferase [Vibrio cholerae]ELJ8501916.1 glycosyltransferase family 2 protein [Vibrio cholerae]